MSMEEVTQALDEGHRAVAAAAGLSEAQVEMSRKAIQQLDKMSELVRDAGHIAVRLARAVDPALFDQIESGLEAGSASYEVAFGDSDKKDTVTGPLTTAVTDVGTARQHAGAGRDELWAMRRDLVAVGQAIALVQPIFMSVEAQWQRVGMAEQQALDADKTYRTANGLRQPPELQA